MEIENHAEEVTNFLLKNKDTSVEKFKPIADKIPPMDRADVFFDAGLKIKYMTVPPASKLQMQNALLRLRAEYEH